MCVGKREQKNDKHQALSASFEQIASNRKDGKISFTWGVLRDENRAKKQKKINNASGSDKVEGKKIVSELRYVGMGKLSCF